MCYCPALHRPFLDIYRADRAVWFAPGGDPAKIAHRDTGYMDNGSRHGDGRRQRHADESIQAWPTDRRQEETNALYRCQRTLCAGALCHRVESLGSHWQLQHPFYLVQAIELIAGPINLILMSLNLRDGLRMAGRLRVSPSQG